MKFNRKELLEVLEKASCALPKDNSALVNGGLKIRGDIIISTDGVMKYYRKLDYDTGLNCAVNGKNLINFIKTIPYENVTITQNDACLLVKSSRLKCEFHITGEVQDSLIPDWIDLEYADIDVNFISGLLKCSGFMYKDASDMKLCGINIAQDRMYATDKVRIIEYSIDNSYGLAGKTISSDAVSIILKNANILKGIYSDDVNTIVKFNDNSYIRISLVAEDFPNIASMIASLAGDSHEFNFKDNKAFISALGIQAKFDIDKQSINKSCEVSFADNLCNIKTESSTNGLLEESLELAEACATGFTFYVNPSFLLMCCDADDTIKYVFGKHVIHITNDNYNCYLMTRG